MLLLVLSRLETALPYEQIKQIVENIPDRLWEPAVPKDTEQMEKIRKSLKLIPEKIVRGPRRVTNQQNKDFPSSLDWRIKLPQCATKVRDQQSCGSCWAFSTTAAFKEFLITCDTWDLGCNGGFLSSACGFTTSTGMVPASCVQYASGGGNAGSCHTKCDDGSQLPPLERSKDYNEVCNSLDDIIGALQRGPITSQMTVYNDFLVYSSGVYHHVYGDLVGYHAVTMIGYGTDEDGQDYWIVQNSWGPNWGEKGYFRIARGSDEADIEHMCYELQF